MNRAMIAVLGTLALSACSSTYPRRDPTGSAFPRVTGKALDGREVTIPDAFAGGPVLLFVGYEQMTQFDIDRWVLGLDSAGVNIRACELPTIPGLAPRMFSGSIDSGMRSGIPKEDWGSVVTVYGDAKRIAEFLGSENGLPARVVLLDGKGRVAFFHDEGYSVASLRRLEAAIAKLRS